MAQMDTGSSIDSRATEDDDDVSRVSAAASRSSSHSSIDDSSYTPVKYTYEYSPDVLLPDQRPLSDEQIEQMRNVEDATSNVLKVIEKYGNAPLPSLDPDDATNEGGWRIDPGSAWADTSSAMKEIADAREAVVRSWRDDGEGKKLEGDAREERDRGKEGPQKQEWWKPILDKDANAGPGNGTKNRDKSANEAHKLTGEEQDQFQAVYMEWSTDAFNEELDALRNGQLEKIASTRRQKRSATAKSPQNKPLPAMELDPTQHSFVVASKGRRGRGDAVDGEAAATAAAKEIDVQVLADILQSGSHFLSNVEKRMLLQARQRASETAGDTSDGYDGLTLHERRKRELGFLV